MLTVLTVEEVSKGISGYLGIDRIKTRILSASGISVRHLVYKSTKGRLSASRIAAKAADGRKRIVYSGRLSLEENKNLGLHSPDYFRGLMCVNAGMSVVKSLLDIPHSFLVGIYDPRGDCPEVCEAFLRYTDNLVVVTGNRGIYDAQCRRLLHEMGAVLCVSRRLSTLSRCHLVIAPRGIERSFRVMEGSLVLSNTAPTAGLSCPVYYRYPIELPGELLPLCPEGAQSDVLASALFSYHKLYSLGTLVPESFLSDTSQITKKQAVSQILANFGT